MGMSLNEETNKYMKEFNIDDYDVIIYEEIFFNDSQLL